MDYIKDFENIEDYTEFASDIANFMDAIKHDLSTSPTEERRIAIRDCIENMKECINAFDYYAKKAD